jgi:hypothetical protein
MVCPGAGAPKAMREPEVSIVPALVQVVPESVECQMPLLADAQRSPVV